MNDKQTCKYLKALRRRIADDNGIPLDIPQCTYEGPCAGTCPRCEAEVQYLEDALAQRLSLGKAAAVAGIALTLAAPAAAQTERPDAADAQPARINCDVQEAFRQSQFRHKWEERGIMRLGGIDPVPIDTLLSKTTYRGTITDSKSAEPIPFANIVILDKEGKTIAGTVSDMDGNYSVSCAAGEGRTMRVNCVGYISVFKELPTADGKTDISIEMQCGATAGVVASTIGIIVTDPPVEIGPNGANQVMETQGVKVRVR